MTQNQKKYGWQLASSNNCSQEKSRVITRYKEQIRIIRA
jgi:hypothetical protein